MRNDLFAGVLVRRERLWNPASPNLGVRSRSAFADGFRPSPLVRNTERDAAEIERLCALDYPQ